MDALNDGPKVIGWEVSDELYADMKGDCYRDWIVHLAWPNGVVIGVRVELQEACPGDYGLDVSPVV